MDTSEMTFNTLNTFNTLIHYPILMLTWKKQQPIEEDYQELFVSEKAGVQPLAGPLSIYPHFMVVFFVCKTTLSVLVQKWW